MKKIICLSLCILGILVMSGLVYAEDGEELISVDLTASSTIRSDMKESGWIFTPDNDKAYEYGKVYGLRFGHYWTQNNAGASIDLDNIGLKYTYEAEITMTTNGAIYIPAENLPSESNYTGKTRITNGYYLLEYSVEIDGIYGRDETNTWTKLYSVDAPALADIVVYKAMVEGDKATIFRNDEELFTYTLPECSEEGEYSYVIKSIYGKGGASCLRKVNITNYTPEIKYEGFAADKKIYEKGIIPATAKSVELVFNMPCEGVTAAIKKGGEAIEAEVEIAGKYIIATPKDGFSYGGEYTIEIESENEVIGLPEMIEFKTAADDFLVDSYVFNEDSADVTVSNYTGKDTKLVAAIFVYKDKKMTGWAYAEAEAANGEAVTVNVGTVDMREADTVKVMVLDSIENMRPLTLAIIKEN